MFPYLTYKLLNEAAYRLAGKSATAPMLAVIGAFPNNLSRIQFDFSHSTTHLGDRLFFLPLMLQLLADGYQVSLDSDDLTTNKILTSLYDLASLPAASKSAVDLVVIAKPAFLAKGRSCPNLLIVDFMDTRIDTDIAGTLTSSFYQLLRCTPSNLSKRVPRLVASDALNILADGQKYFLFSNYINSGLFRKWFVNEEKLLQQCKDLQAEGFQIIHVGSAEDKAADSRSYPFVGLDLRGGLTLPQLIALVASPQVEGAVTYDNFLMHLMGLYEKRAFVLFRGRFSKKNQEHHFRSVNGAFFKKDGQLTYL